MDELRSIMKVTLGAHHRQPSRVGASITAEGTTIPKPPFTPLELARYPREKSCYIFHTSVSGESTDTWHETLDAALDYAEDMYGVQRNEWVNVDYVFGSSER